MSESKIVGMFDMDISFLSGLLYCYNENLPFSETR